MLRGKNVKAPSQVSPLQVGGAQSAYSSASYKRQAQEVTLWQG